MCAVVVFHRFMCVALHVFLCMTCRCVHVHVCVCALCVLQEYFGITPDVTTMGKVIGGGLPVGAYGGKKEIMEMVAPAGPMYQAGK